MSSCYTQCLLPCERMSSVLGSDSDPSNKYPQLSHAYQMDTHYTQSSRAANTIRCSLPGLFCPCQEDPVECLSSVGRTSGDALFKGQKTAAHQAGTVRATDCCMFLGMSLLSCVTFFSLQDSFSLFTCKPSRRGWSRLLCHTQQKGSLTPQRPPVPTHLQSFLMETHQPASSR